MFSRLLALVGLLLLTQAFFGQQSAQQSQTATSNVPETCPVTKASDHPFIPPWPYPKVPYPGGSWFGTDRLWISPPEDGTWRGLGHYTPTDPTFRQKMAWWRQGFDWRTEPDFRARLTVTGRRLDAQAAPLMPVRANSVLGKLPYMMVAFDLPTLGCWEITGHYEDDELTFVVWLSK